MNPIVRTPGLTWSRLADFNHDTAKMLMNQMQKVLDAYGCKTVEELLAKAPQPEAAHTEWLEDELMAVMQTVAPGMGGQLPDEMTYAIMVTAIRRLIEADTDRYEALLERWQARSRPQKGESRMLDDGFGNAWEKCSRKDCGLEIVRPGKVQCDKDGCPEGRRSAAGERE